MVLAGQSVSGRFSLTIQNLLSITTTSLQNGVVGTPFQISLQASGGDGSYVWALSVGTLPNGLTLDSDGTLSGTPTTPGVSTSSITIYFGLAVTTSSLPDGQVGVFYGQSLTAIGGDGSYTWSIIAGSLPPGLSLVPSTGLISGTPTTAGTSNFTVQVVSGDAQTATAALSIEIKLSP